MQLRRRSDQRAFALIEVLVSLLLAGLAVVGLATAQASALRTTRMGLHRTVAQQAIADLAERLRANRVGASNTESGASPYQLQQTWSAQQSDAAQPLAQSCDGPQAVCTPLGFAQADLAQWQTLLRRSLPSAAGWVQVDVAAGLADVAVAWTDARPLNLDEAPRGPDECPAGLGIDATSTVRCLQARVAW